jgi:hypothetical protein
MFHLMCTILMLSLNTVFNKLIVLILLQCCYSKVALRSVHIVTLPSTVTPYRDSVDGTRDRVMYQMLNKQ